VEFGEAYKLEADGPYCHVYFETQKKTLSKTLKKVLTENEGIFLRINRKYAVNVGKINGRTPDEVKLINNEILKFSRRMKTKIILLLMCMLPMVIYAQVMPKDTIIKKVKVIKQGTSFILEQSTETVTYKLLDGDYLLNYENSLDFNSKEQRKKMLDLENSMIAAEIIKEQAEKREVNKVLKAALRQGFNPQTNTLEGIEKLKKIKENIEKAKD